MKTSITYLLVVAGSLLLQSACMPVSKVTSGSTESYIKNMVEKHEEGQFSTVRTFGIFSGLTANMRHLEITGYKYAGAKNLVIAARDSYTVKEQQETGTYAQTVYIQLSSRQAGTILANYEALAEKIKKDQPVAGETVYHDFTVSPDLFISYSRVYGGFANQSATYMHLWINGIKYTISTAEVIRRMEQFVNY